MNPSSAGMWCNPPPPGTDEDLSNGSVKQESPERAIDRIDPFLKSSEYIKYERKLEHRRRSRSRSRHRRHRSRSRGRHKHRRRRYSSSRSRSRSRRHKRSRHSRSQSKTRSRSHSHRRRRRSRSRKRSRSRDHTHQKPEPAVEDKTKVEEEVEDEEEDASNENQFKNDGSFMEMFKRMQEEELKKKEAENAAPETKAPPPAFGKRRGGKVLKTGMVQKNKSAGQEDGDAQDAWTLYMKEVKRYKEACCDDDSKTRLLVK